MISRCISGQKIKKNDKGGCSQFASCAKPANARYWNCHTRLLSAFLQLTVVQLISNKEYEVDFRSSISPAQSACIQWSLLSRLWSKLDHICVGLALNLVTLLTAYVVSGFVTVDSKLGLKNSNLLNVIGTVHDLDITVVFCFHKLCASIDWNCNYFGIFHAGWTIQIGSLSWSWMNLPFTSNWSATGQKCFV